MRTSTPRETRNSSHVPVKTIDLFKQPKPVGYTNMGYTMSVPAPLQDPCAYASTVSGRTNNTRPANRITDCLAPTYEETESKSSSKNESSQRSTAGDPALELAKKHDISLFKQHMTIAGIPCEKYDSIRSSRLGAQRSQNNATNSHSGDVTLLGDASTDSMNISTTMVTTPLRRGFEGPQGSTAKRQRIMKQSDGDISSDTIRSVLRLVDESLVDTPERRTVATPKVLRAVPGPSPREHGPIYAYEKRSVPPKPSILTPFTVTRI